MADVVTKVITAPVSLGPTVAFKRDKGKHSREETSRESTARPRPAAHASLPEDGHEQQGKGKLIDIRA